MKSTAQSALMFVVHQVMATFGVLAAAPWVIAAVAQLLRPFGWTITMRQSHWILTETHYFPAQIAFALLLGSLYGRYLWHWSLRWVWVVPFLILGCCVIANASPFNFGPVSVFAPQSRLSHFFGPACQVQNGCFDQLTVTLPFYSAAAYSIGASLARKTASSDATVGGWRIHRF